MTLQNQGRRWRVCLFLTAAASVNSQLHLDSCHGVSGGRQPRKELVIALCRGGSRSSFPREEQPPPPPPRPPPVSKKKEKQQQQQQQQQGRFWSGHFIPPPPPHQPSGELSHAQQPQRNDMPRDESASPKLASLPSHLDSESHHATWRPRPPPPLPRTFPDHVRSRDPRQPAPPASRPGNARQQQVQQSRTVKSTPESSSSTREDLATAHDPAFVLLPEGGSASVGDRRNGPFVPRPNDGGVFVGNAPCVPRRNNGSASASDKWSSPSSMDSNPIDKNLDNDIRTAFPRLDWKALATADFILVSPENVEQLDRISLKTGLRPKEDRREATLGGSLVHLRHHELVLEQLLQSQESIREEMVAIAQLLRALLVAVVRHENSLVPHVPRHLARVVVAPRIARRRRVERKRMIPRRTILSTLDDLDRDLSDGEFHVLLHGLMQPSEVEEVYHEYEYDQEDFLPQQEQQQQLHHPIHITSNQEEFHEFLRETSDSETAEQYYEQDQYDSDFSYDYYNDEPLDELWDEDSLTDMEVGELTNDEILHSDKEDVEMSARDPESGFSYELASREENHVPNDNVCDEAPETSSQRNESSEANGPKDSIMRAGTSASRRPPPPPPRHHSTKGHSHWQSDETRIRPPVHCTLPTGAGVRTAEEGPKKPPQPPPPRVPPDRYRMTPLPPISKVSLEVPEESAWSDQSDDLDQDEVRLLEDTAINEVDDRMRDKEEEIEDYEDGIDEDDFRILQLSRWTPPNGGKRSRWAPFLGRKKQNFDDEEEEEDLFVDEAIYLDEALYDAMTTDDFTDIEVDTPALPASLAEDDESSEDDMILGESAVTDIPGYTENHFGDPKLNSNAPLAHHGNAHFRLLQPPPPPPRPPPRQASAHNASKMHPAIQQPHVQQALQPQLARATGQSTHYEVHPPYSSQQRELYDRPMSHAAASHSSHVTGNPNTHTNPQLHNARDTWHPNGDAEKSQYKR